MQAEAKKRNVSTKGSRNMALQRIGAHAVKCLATGASSSGGGAGSSAGGAGGAGPAGAQAPQLPQQPTAQPESKPAGGSILSSEGQARADAGMAMLQGEDDGTQFL